MPTLIAYISKSVNPNMIWDVLLCGSIFYFSKWIFYKTYVLKKKIIIIKLFRDPLKYYVISGCNLLPNFMILKYICDLFYQDETPLGHV